jgi:AI-2 transport protein TqsA
MNTAENSNTSKTSLLVSLASLCIIIGGLKWAQPFFIPILLAAFITIISFPLFIWLKQKKVPTSLSLTFVLIFLASIFAIFGFIVVISANDLITNLPFYEIQLKSKLALVSTTLLGLGISLDSINIQDFINPTQALDYFSLGVSQLSSVFTGSIVILIIVAFMLLEASYLHKKIELNSENKKIQTALLFMKKVNKYMVLKTIISLATGLCVTLSLLILDIHYPILWGLIAFILNFVPNIGSIIAAIPAIILAIIQVDFTMGLFVFIAYLVINFAIGNVIEPIYMGDKLGLSPLVIVLALLFWGWVFGPIGMLLSVPLTIVVKFGLESFESTKHLALFMESRS